VRLGRNKTNKPRPLLLSLSSESEVLESLKRFNEKKASGGNSLQSLSISRDRTEMERSFLHSVRAELKTRVDAGEFDLTIKYVKGIPTIVSKNCIATVM
jgi:hypothetical protein